MQDKQQKSSHDSLEPRPNGAVPHETQTPALQRTHSFSPREKAFFVRQLQQMSALQGAINTAIALVIEQQGFEGNWRLMMDGSGLERIDPPQATG
jgi:hypothetical protein